LVALVGIATSMTLVIMRPLMRWHTLLLGFIPGFIWGLIPNIILNLIASLTLLATFFELVLLASFALGNAQAR
jgi:hypothetical protein